MPKQLIPTSVSAPAFFGVNTQRKSDILPFQWATKADNCVIDDSGRIAARKGYQNVNDGVLGSTDTVRSIFEYIDASGNTLEIFAANNVIYKVSGDTPVDISLVGGGGITAPTADNWKFQNFNGKVIGFQSGHSPIVMSTVGGNFTDISYTANAPSSTDEGLASFGRIWNIDGVSLLYSSTLDETNSIAGYGSFDLSSVWLSGMDIPVALAEFNGHLVVFGKQSIIIYSNPWSPATDMQVVENIGGMGCIARDSIQYVGDDILFLSSQGVRSLGRTIQEKSMPIRVVSGNVNDELNALVNSETLANIKSAYSKTDGFYILSLPTSNKTYYFDLRQPLQDGSYKTTIWQTSFTGMNVTTTNVLRLGTAGHINTYQGHLDNVDSTGTGGETYQVVYESGWNDLDQPSVHKLPKRLAVLMLGGNGQTVVLKWAFDFVDTFTTFSRTIGDITFAEFNIAEFGEKWVTVEGGAVSVQADEYAGTAIYNRTKTPMSKSGQLVKFGINITIEGSAVALQQIDMYSKFGRIAV